MPGNNSDLPKLPLRLSVLQIIGLKDPDEGNWSRLRALQYAQLHKVQLTRAIAHALAVVTTVSLFLGKVPVVMLVGWAAAVGAAPSSTR